MQIREAMLKAADQIERNPHTFDYSACLSYSDCGTPMCALGWIGHFLCAYGTNGLWVACGAMGYGEMHHRAFYNDMVRVVGFGWTASPTLCAKGLRLLADEKFPITPDWNKWIAESKEHPNVVPIRAAA